MAYADDIDVSWKEFKTNVEENEEENVPLEDEVYISDDDLEDEVLEFPSTSSTDTEQMSLFCNKY